MRRIKAGLLVCLALGSLVWLVPSCQLIEMPEQNQGELLSSTVQVARGDMKDVVQVAGQVVARESRELVMGTVGGYIKKVHVGLGQEVQAGAPLVELETDDLERALREAQAGLKVAEAVLAEAQRTAAAAEIAQARADLANAEYALALAKRDLDLAEAKGLTPYEQGVAIAQAEVVAAKDELALLEIQSNSSEIRRLEYQQDYLQRLVRDTKPGAERDEAEDGLADVRLKLDRSRTSRATTLRQARERIAEKEVALEEAQAELARVRSGEQDPLALLRLAYEQARLAEEDARQYLADLEAGMDSAAVKAARTNLEAAQAQVDDAVAAIEDATLVAPFAGTVMRLSARVGQRVQPSDSLVYLVDMNALRVRAQVSEVDVAKLTLGQQVRISFDSDPRTVYDGEITTMPAKGEFSGGMSFFQIESSIEAATGVRPNTLANMRVIVGDKRDVLLIPSAALQTMSARYSTVTLMGADGQMRTERIETGLNDGIMVEVLSGLQEGDTIVMPLIAPGQAGGGGAMPADMPIERVEVEVEAGR